MGRCYSLLYKFCVNTSFDLKLQQTEQKTEDKANNKTKIETRNETCEKT